MTFVAYRDAGFWTLALQICSFAWRRGRLKFFPPKGFVGRVSLSSVVTGRPPYRLESIRLFRNRYTRNAPRWRLTCEWLIPPPAPPPRKYGRFLERFGRRSADVGGETSDLNLTSTTSKSSQLPHHHYHP